MSRYTAARPAPSRHRWLIAILVACVVGCGQPVPGGTPTAAVPPMAGSPSAEARAGSPGAASSATVAPVDLTVAAVYRRAGEALARPGLLYHATVHTEGDFPHGHLATTSERWVDARRQVARQEEAGRLEEENGHVDTSRQTMLLADRARYVGSAGRPVTVLGACRGVAVAIAAALGCPSDSRYAPATTAVEAGAHEGRPTLVLVAIVTLGGDYRGTQTTRLYLDPETCLPFAAAAEGEIEVAAGEPGSLRPETRRVWHRAAYAHDFIPVAAVPADFFDPAALGYVAPGDDLARPAPAFPDFRAYWLGERFAGAGDLPPLAPGRVDRPAGPGSGPGYLFILSYGRAEDPYGGIPPLTLQQWPRAPWDAMLAQAPGAHYWDGPCWAREELALPGGHATIFSGHEAPGGGQEPGATPGATACPAAPPDRFVALVDLGGTIVLVDAPSAGLPDGTTVTSPYNSRAGMEAVVRALPATLTLDRARSREHGGAMRWSPAWKPCRRPWSPPRAGP